MTYRRARDFSDVVFGDAGKDTLTVRNGKRALVRLLLKAKRLDRLVGGRNDDEQEAMAMVDDMLLSPVLKGMLCKATSRWILSGASIVARTSRGELGDHDARILGGASHFTIQGADYYSRFRFLPRDFHASLIREGGLIAGVYTLSELSPKMRNLCLLMEKEGRQCTFEDAETLAQYEGLVPTRNECNDFVQRAMAV
jgi:hypothetical protein